MVGNANYGSMPSVTACARSGHAVAAALHRLGLTVIEVEDATLGQLDAAIGDFANRLAKAPHRPGLVYFCGYASSYNHRAFLLPVSASITRPTDLLTRGVVASSLIRALAPRPAASVMVLDLVAMPHGGDAAAALTQRALPAGLGMAVAAVTGKGTTPTPLAAGLVRALPGPTVTTNALFAALAKPAAGQALAVLHKPSPDSYLAGEAPPPPPPRPKPQPAPIAASAKPAPKPAAAPVPFPAEADMTDPQRREVQAALLNLGYYDGAVDGIIGPNTRAAIRRYQHELHAPMTGVLTSAQATRLVARMRH